MPASRAGVSRAQTARAQTDPTGRPYRLSLLEAAKLEHDGPIDVVEGRVEIDRADAKVPARSIPRKPTVLDPIADRGRGHARVLGRLVGREVAARSHGCGRADLGADRLDRGGELERTTSRTSSRSASSRLIARHLRRGSSCSSWAPPLSSFRGVAGASASRPRGAARPTPALRRDANPRAGEASAR